MPATAGNAWTLSVGKQTAQGTPLPVSTMKLRYTGGFGPAPVRVPLTLAETDASRQQGDPIVVGLRVEGSSSHYVRPSEFHRIADLALGSTVSTGTTNYTHTSSSTASGSAGFATLFRALNVTTLVDRYVDCQVSSLSVTGGAEQALTCDLAWLGLSATFGETDPAVAVTSDSPLVYPHVTATIGGSAASIIDSFTLNINQNRTLVLGDTGLSAGAIVPGQYVVDGSYSILFESAADWREFNTGTTAGTIPGTTIAQKPLIIAAVAGVNNSVTFDMDAIITTAYNPDGNTDGGPIRVPVTFTSARGATLANVLEVITKNQVATV